MGKSAGRYTHRLHSFHPRRLQRFRAHLLRRLRLRDFGHGGWHCILVLPNNSL